MLENSNNGFSCGNADMLISFVFGELDQAALRNFERHSLNCKVCSEEVRELLSARNAVVDWRKDAFSGLKPIKVEIPYPQPIPFCEQSDPSPNGWLEKTLLQIRFAASLRFGVAAASALAVVCIGFLLFSFYNSNSGINSLAENSVRSVDKVASVQQGDTGHELDPKLSDTPERIVESSRTADVKQPLLARKPPVSVYHHQPRGQEMSVKVKGGPNTMIKRPTLTEVADEGDTSLRLSELFDEIGG